MGESSKGEQKAKIISQVQTHDTLKLKQLQSMWLDPKFISALKNYVCQVPSWIP